MYIRMYVCMYERVILYPSRTHIDLTKGIMFPIGDRLHMGNHKSYSIINLFETVPARSPSLLSSNSNSNSNSSSSSSSRRFKEIRFSRSFAMNQRINHALPKQLAKPTYESLFDPHNPYPSVITSSTSLQSSVAHGDHASTALSWGLRGFPRAGRGLRTGLAYLRLATVAKKTDAFFSSRWYAHGGRRLYFAGRGGRRRQRQRHKTHISLYQERGSWRSVLGSAVVWFNSAALGD